MLAVSRANPRARSVNLAKRGVSVSSDASIKGRPLNLNNTKSSNYVTVTRMSLPHHAKCEDRLIFFAALENRPT
ncbi:hypothetical protein TNCT_24611, partial [Trichonephila clavata]